MFAGAHIGGLGARRVADALVALDQQAGDVAVAEFDRQRQAGWATPKWRAAARRLPRSTTATKSRKALNFMGFVLYSGSRRS